MDRFSRDVDITDLSPVTSNRFERIEKEASSVEKALGTSALQAEVRDGQVHMRLGSLETRGPTFNLGVVFLGEALQEDALVACSDKPLVLEGRLEGALSEGAKLLVEKLGPDFLASLARPLPERTFEDRGKQHRVYRRGLRKAKGSSLSEAITNAIEADEVVFEGSLLG